MKPIIKLVIYSVLSSSIVFTQEIILKQTTFSTSAINTTGDNSVMVGTVGQTFVGELESNSTVLSAGFWGSVASILLGVDDVIPTEYKEGVRVGRWKKYSHTTPYIKNQGFKGGLYNDFRYKDKYEVDELKTLVDEGLEGLLHGPFIQYFYNRNIEFEGSYKNNKKDGLFKEYSFQGELESEQNYKEGEVVD